jgi:hypothetical protein
MAWKNNEECFDLTDKFCQIMREAFGTVSPVGGLGDGFGGILLLAYLPPEAGCELPALKDDLEELTALLQNQKKVEDLANTAREKYRSKIFDTINRANRDLMREVMAPLYELAGPIPIWTDVVYEHHNHLGAYGTKKLLRKEVKDGVTVSRLVKQRGRPKRPVTEQKVQRAFDRLGKNANQRTVALHLKITTVTLRGWFKSAGFKNWKKVDKQFRKAK